MDRQTSDPSAAPAAGEAAREVLIGVHVTAASQDLVATLAAIHGATTPPFRLAVLVDPAAGEEQALADLLAGLRGIPQLTPDKGGAAACFNRLLACPADVYVFLECGALPGPGWLAHLQAALDADPTHGLAGPSTNHCWNEQGVAPGCGASEPELRRAAATVFAKFGRACRPMAPLHNLADFCLTVRADVVAAVGAADEAYGRGPCWEMDYGVRAARAGFRSVWAKAAFVRRGALPAWRLAAEPALLEASKRLYQDRFCGLRRTPEGARAAYHDACGGEACPAFAPADTVAVRLPLARMTLPAVDQPPPLISCVMPTRGRARFVAQSVAYFRRQTYPNRELVIVYESDADLPAGLEGDDIRLVRTTQCIVGAKRNVAAQAARGEIIAHWDDDDWYGPERLARQAAPILQGVADITGLNDVLFMVAPSRAFWAATPELFARLFVENISGGTLMFRRSAWELSGPYPAISLREDVEFMVRAMRDGARLCRAPGRDVCVYVRHDANTWKFSEGQYLQPDQWLPAAAPAFIRPDLGFYWSEPAAKPAPRPTPRRSEGPLVSCLMPTANRRAFVPQAIRAFLAQDYPDRELIVIDDGRESVEDLIPPDESIRYVRLDRRLTIGAKRNAAAELSRGEILAHWDDDDWMAPRWLGSQVRTLLEQKADVCGLDKVYFYAPETRQGWRYVYDGPQPWVCGGTLCYTKDLWRRSPFQEIDVGEDNQFVWSPAPKRLAINRRHDLYVATVHRGNTSPKLTTNRRWRSVPAARIEQLMRDLPAPEDAV